MKHIFNITKHIFNITICQKWTSCLEHIRRQIIHTEIVKVAYFQIIYTLRYIITFNENTRYDRVSSSLSLMWISGSRLRSLKFCVTQATFINENRLPIRTAAYTNARQKLVHTLPHHTGRPVGDSCTPSSLYILNLGIRGDTLAQLTDECLYLSLNVLYDQSPPHNYNDVNNGWGHRYSFESNERDNEASAF
jgi:hypothetical protein